MRIQIVEGDLLDQEVDVIVNAWNRNVIPWWLILPQGVSGAIKQRAGHAPFRELARHGPMPLGSAVLTSSGKLRFKGIIHVAGISMWWRASEASIRASVNSAIGIVNEHAFRSVAIPIIGAGTGGFDEQSALAIVVSELSATESEAVAVVVRFRRGRPDASHSGSR